MVNYEKTLLKYSNSYISTKQIKMNFEKSRECNCVNVHRVAIPTLALHERNSK
jgi:hypothetical protein